MAISSIPEAIPGTPGRDRAGRARALRILMIAPQPFFRPRGTPISVLQRLSALSKLGHSVDLVTYPFGDSPSLANVRIHRTLRPPGVRDVAVGPSWAKVFLDGPVFARAFRMARRRGYDVLHTHEEAGVMGAIISRASGIPHVYDMHSSLPEQFSNYGRFNWPPVVATFQALERFVLARAEGVIAVCPALRDLVAASGYRGHLAMIENTFDGARPPTDPNAVGALRSRHGLDGGPVVVYAGTLEPYQGLDLLIEAATIVRRTVGAVRFMVIGGASADREPLQRLAAERGVAAGFAFLPPVSPAEVWNYYDLADALVTCRTRGSNTPLKIYQFLRSAKPIVATAIHSHTQVLDADTAELVEVSPEGIAAGIVRVLTDGPRAAALIAGARRAAETRLRDEVYLERLASLLASVTEK